MCCTYVKESLLKTAGDEIFIEIAPRCFMILNIKISRENMCEKLFFDL